MMKKKKILLLGGTGAMGSHLVEVLNRSNEWEIFVTTRNNQNNNSDNITYILGNARDYNFINDVCQNHFDAIVDFMNYNLDEFEKNYEVLLKATDHYLFLSSSRVYTNSPLINEQTKRLLDTSKDAEFLKTNRYALRKAREENILKKSPYLNWTIIRPYITYSNRRLQLGVYEKEEWLYRILNDKPLVIRKDILDKYTTLTYGRDVAAIIANIIGDNSTLLKAINPVTSENIRWQEILELYVTIIREKLGKEPKIFYSNELSRIEELFEGGYNTKYDRLWNRVFDNEVAKKYLPYKEFKGIKDGLTDCLSEFINDWLVLGNDIFGVINPDYDIIMNEMSDSFTEEKWKR